MERLKNERLRNSTHRNYYSVWRTFNEFFVRLDVRPNDWSDRLSLFVTYLVDQKYRSQTVKSYISAIKGVLREDGVQIHADQFLLSALTCACRMKNDNVKARLPIHKGMLQIIVRKTVEHFNSLNQPYLARLYSSVFVTMYFGLLRVGEVTTGNHPVQVGDVHVGFNKKKILLIL